MGDELSVGHKLWYVPSERWHGKPREVVVTKVGRKWATIESDGREIGRVDKDSLIVDGGGYSSPGHCCRDRATHEAEVAKRAAWDSLRQAMRDQYRIPADLTTEQILAFYTLLASKAPSQALTDEGKG